MLIGAANAQEVPVNASQESSAPPAPSADTTAMTAVPGADPALAPPSPQSVILQNVGMIVLLVVMFYFLLIRPQQKRFKEQKAMVEGLKAGDRVITAGGLVGRIDSLGGTDEAVIDLGNGVKVTALRGTLSARVDKPANDAAKR